MYSFKVITLIIDESQLYARKAIVLAVSKE